MDKPLRVLQIGFNLSIGGIENVVMNYYRNIDKSKVVFDFICFQKDGGYKDEIEQTDSRIYYCEVHGSKWNRFVQSVFQITRILKEHHYDIVHVHSCSFAGLLRGTISAKLAGVRYVIAHGHNPGIPKNNVIDAGLRWCLRQFVTFTADYYFACSKEVAESKYAKRIIQKHRYTIIKNAIQTEKFRYNPELRQEYRLKLELEDKLVIGSISRLEYQKNHDFMLEVFKEVYKQNEKAVLLLVGTGSLENELKEKAQRLGIEKQVIFYGLTKSPAPLYNVIDIYLSTSHYEGLGISLVEAQTCGCVCVTSPVPEETNVTGQLVELPLSENAEQWADRILNCEVPEREKNIRLVQDAGYEIADAAKVLERFYLNLKTH
jgi:glycosyltransferase involved in cell wall biosynthesis